MPINKMKPKKSPEDHENDELLEAVHFEIDKDAFKGPFTCCGRTTKKVIKRTSYAGLEATYEAWKCTKCGKDYLEGDQSKKLEKIWALQLFLEGRAPKVQRSINYDGKTFFVRFPKDLTGTWTKKKKALLTMLTPQKYLVEIA